MTIPDKRPRHYAAEIIALPTRAARAAALDAVPEIIRDWVRHLVEDHFAKRALGTERKIAPSEHRARRAPDTSAPKYPTPAPPKAPATGEPVAGRAALSRLREVLA